MRLTRCVGWARVSGAAQASCAGMLGILLGRIGTGMERPHDRNQVMGVLTLFPNPNPNPNPDPHPNPK